MDGPTLEAASMTREMGANIEIPKPEKKNKKKQRQLIRLAEFIMHQSPPGRISFILNEFWNSLKKPVRFFAMSTAETKGKKRKMESKGINVGGRCTNNTRIPHKHQLLLAVNHAVHCISNIVDDMFHAVLIMVSKGIVCDAGI